MQGRWLVQGIVHSFGATRCIILHLVTSQSLQHAAGNAEVPLVVYSLVIAVTALFCIQARCLRIQRPLGCAPAVRAVARRCKGCREASLTGGGGRLQVKAMNKLGWFLTFGTFGQAFAALIVTVSLIARPLPAYQRQTVAFQTGARCPAEHTWPALPVSGASCERCCTRKPAPAAGKAALGGCASGCSSTCAEQGAW